MRLPNRLTGAIAAAAVCTAAATAAVAAAPKQGGHYTGKTANAIKISLHVSPRGKTIRAAVTCRHRRHAVVSQWMTIKHGRFIGAARQPGAPNTGSVGPAYAISGRIRSRTKITGLLYNDAIRNSNQRRYTARLIAH